MTLVKAQLSQTWGTKKDIATFLVESVMLRDRMGTRKTAMSVGVTGALFVLFSVLWLCPLAQAETVSSFDSTDKFEIPQNHSVIKFATNGTYEQATLENSTWVFKNLHLNRSTATLETLRVSAQNSNMTIITYRKSEIVSQSARISYKVQGQGVQTVNLGRIPAAGILSVIYNNGTFIAENQGWTATKEGAVTITGAPDGTNVTVAYFVFLDYPLDYESQPFYLQHSVALGTLAAVAVTMAVTAAVWHRNKLKKTEIDGVN